MFDEKKQLMHLICICVLMFGLEYKCLEVVALETQTTN